MARALVPSTAYVFTHLQTYILRVPGKKKKKKKEKNPSIRRGETKENYCRAIVSFCRTFPVLWT